MKNYNILFKYIFLNINSIFRIILGLKIKKLYFIRDKVHLTIITSINYKNLVSILSRRLLLHHQITNTYIITIFEAKHSIYNISLQCYFQNIYFSRSHYLEHRRKGAKLAVLEVNIIYFYFFNLYYL